MAKKEELIELLKERNIEIPMKEGFKTTKTLVEGKPEKIKEKVLKPVWTNHEMEVKLGDWFLENGARQKSWGLLYRKSMLPMLCASYKHAPEETKKELFESDNIIAERKWNGCRMIITYHPQEGIKFFSRGISDHDFLPIEYTEKVLMIANGLVRNGASFINRIPIPFVLDSEVIVETKEINTTLSRMGITTGSELNAVAAMLQLNAEVSQQIQMQQAPLVFKVFDIMLYDDKELINVPLRNRKNILAKFIPALNNAGINFSLSTYGIEGKKEFYEDTVAKGGEGIVLKNLDSPYNIDGTRHFDKWVKVKRSMNEQVGDDIDAFVIGGKCGNPGTNIENVIASLDFAVYLIDNNGIASKHHIATVSGIPEDMRISLTDYKDGKPCLKDAWLGKVFAIDGHTISAKSLRFNHAKVKDWNPRIDKNEYACELQKELLLQNIL